MITQWRKGAEKRVRTTFESLLCASAPVRESVVLCLFCFSSSCATQASQKEDVASSPAPSNAGEVQQTAKLWPLGRGNALADGVGKTTLPDKPEVVWKVTVEKGAFDGTPVIAEGVVYLGDMDGKVYAWSLADGK